MSTFLDGPAAGVGLMLRRAPLFLRVVIGADGKIDALDQLDDEPAAGETIHVYRLAAPAVRAHLCSRGKLKAASGWYEIGHYQHLPDVDGETLRETGAWRRWASAAA